MGITLKQIAEMAGTTKSTVDKVLHDRPGVSEKKRQEIKELLRKYGYEANPLAKALNYQKRKMKVAVVLPQISAAADIKRGMDVVRQDFMSFNIQLDYHELGASDAEGQVRALRAIEEEEPAGLIILPVRSEKVTDAVRRVVRKKIPVVIVNSEIPVEGVLCYVGQDMIRSGAAAARMLQLLTQGKAEIGIISCKNMIGHEQREQSFIQTVNRCYPELHIQDIKYIEETPEDAYGKTLEVFAEHPEIDALFVTCGCVEDICRAVRASGRGGDEIKQPAIVCYEKYAEIIDLVKKGEIACTLTGGLSKQGRIAMRVMFEYLVYDQVPSKKAYYFKNRIIIKENS